MKSRDREKGEEAVFTGFWDEEEKKGLGKGHMKMLTPSLCS